MVGDKRTTTILKQLLMEMEKNFRLQLFQLKAAVILQSRFKTDRFLPMPFQFLTVQFLMQRQGSFAGSCHFTKNLPKPSKRHYVSSITHLNHCGVIFLPNFGTRPGIEQLRMHRAPKHLKCQVCDIGSDITDTHITLALGKQLSFTVRHFPLVDPEGSATEITSTAERIFCSHTCLRKIYYIGGGMEPPSQISQAKKLHLLSLPADVSSLAPLILTHSSAATPKLPLGIGRDPTIISPQILNLELDFNCDWRGLSCSQDCFFHPHRLPMIPRVLFALLFFCLAVSDSSTPAHGAPLVELSTSQGKYVGQNRGLQ